MNMRSAMREMVRVLRAENDALAAGDLDGALLLLPGKEEAAAQLRAALPDAVAETADPELAAALRLASQENGERLSLAIEVQGRVLELVAHAARLSTPAPAQYGRRGTLAGPVMAQALALRA